MVNPLFFIRTFTVTVVGAAALSATVAAADASTSASAHARYRQELAICDAGKSHQSLASCRLEAKKAYAETLRGGFVDDASQYQRNALARCDAQSGEARSECEMRINGQGNVKGSVEAGGVLRSSITIVPAN